MLNRQNQNQDTWKALELRMGQSKKLLYVMTDNSIKSPCTEREVMYFKNASKDVKVYMPYPVSLPTPSYLDGCDFITEEQLPNL